MGAGSDAKRDATRGALLSGVAAVAAALRGCGGPFLLGAQPSYGDFMLWPFVERFCVLAHYRKFAVPPGAPYDAFHVWVDAMRGVPAVRAVAQPADFLVAGYESYIAPDQESPAT